MISKKSRTKLRKVAPGSALHSGCPRLRGPEVSLATPGTPRHYKLEPGERLLAVNALLRISGVRFESGQQRASRSGTCVLGDETHKNIQACLPYDTVGVTVRGPVQA